MAGIAAVGFYLPRYAIAAEEYRRALGKFDAPAIREKSVPGFDEDEITMAVAAADRAIGAEPPAFLTYGSSSRTSAEGTVSEALGLESAAKREILGEPDAGVAALHAAVEFTAKDGGIALAIASDAPRAFAGSAAEHPLGGAAVACLVTADGPVRRTEALGSGTASELLARVGHVGAASPLLAFLDAMSRLSVGSRVSAGSLAFDLTAKPAGDLDLRSALDRRISLTYERYVRVRRYEPPPPGTEYSQGAYVSPSAYRAETKARYRLIGERCTTCGRLHFPPRESCLACGGRSWEDVPLRRTGTVYAYTIIGSGAAPSEFLEQQLAVGEYATAVVSLDDGPRVAAMLTDVEPADVKIGLPVRMVFRRIYAQEGATRYGFKFAPQMRPGEPLAFSPRIR